LLSAKSDITETISMKNNREFITLIVLLIIVTITTSACVSPESRNASVTPAPELTTVKVAYMPIISFGPLFIAKDEGFFARQGINVEFEKFTSTSSALPALINGDIAVSGGQLSPGLINSISEGAHVRIVANKGVILPGSCISDAILVRRDLVESGAVKTVADLKGKKIAGGDDQTYGVNRALALGNLTTGDVELVSMPRAAIPVGFENQAFDAAYLMEPYITQVVRNGKAVIFLPGEAFTPNLTNPLYYGTAFTETNPELGRRFMIAYLQGVRQYNQGKTDRNLKILSNYTQMNRDDLNETCWVQIVENGEISRQPVSEYMDWMYANNKITRKVEESQLFDMSYVTYADAVLQNMTTNG
jgi:NitT/TauT family transport system substrate-binding protein